MLLLQKIHLLFSALCFTIEVIYGKEVRRMDLNSRRLKNAAAETLTKTACDPRRLVALHTAVMLAVSLAAWGLDLVLQNEIGNTGGLGGVGVRSVLETVQTILRQAQIIVMPIWQIGWVYTVLKIARGERAGKAELAEGFRRFFPVLRLMILKGLILMGVIFAAAYISSFIVMMTPLGDSIAEFAISDITQITDAQLIDQIMALMMPMMIIMAVLALVLYVPFFYRFRLAEYFLMENPQLGARAALRNSRVTMRGNGWKWLRLDLSFWWFWLLTVLVSALGWTDMLLPAAGIELPWTENVSYVAAYVLAAVAQLALHYFCKAKVDVTYAHAYMELLPKEE